MKRANMSKAAALVENMIGINKRVHITRAAAGLSYFLMLAIFPLLLCVYTMLVHFMPDMETVKSVFTAILPSDSVGALIDNYLLYISGSDMTAGALVTAIVTMATTTAGVVRTLSNVMGEMRGSKRFTGLLSFLLSFVFALVFLLAVYVAVIMVLTGNWFISFVDRHIPFLDVSASWNWIRFVLLFLLLFVVITAVYRFTAPKYERIILLPGAITASVALVGVSILFSYFINMSTKYPVVYGSLASVMIMMLWLYICGMVLFGGNMLNVALEMYHRE
ncbi:MAG: YihY/virulence factor BrkB family protein [Oscillospiraceae bacterium]